MTQMMLHGATGLKSKQLGPIYRLLPLPSALCGLQGGSPARAHTLRLFLRSLVVRAAMQAGDNLDRNLWRCRVPTHLPCG